jgi:hypothetical protein
MEKVTRSTRLSALRELIRDPRKTDDQINPRVVTIIKQSLEAEGYAVSEQEVREAGERVL